MKPSDHKLVGSDPIDAVRVGPAASVYHEPSVGRLEDPRVFHALEEYRAALETGGKPEREEFLARYPEIAQSLAECLDGLDFVHQAAPHLSQPAIADTAVPAAEIQPEGPLGDFRIIREIGRGGMGVVYEAVQISLGRKVALKVLPFAATLDPKQLQRFKNEAQAAGQLHHTHIVPVHAVGCERGVHYYAMQFIEGQTLAQLIQQLRGLAGHGAAAAYVSRSEERRGRETQAAPAAEALANSALHAATTPQQVGTTRASTNDPASFRTVAQLGVQVAEALEYAHGEGVIHRDIKPANLLVDGKGQLWITDFGLARCRDNVGLTMTGDVVGTLRYMSPEQALAKRLLIDHRTDIYSLGVTLYELATLEPAFSGSDREELLQQIAFEEPPAPRRRNKAIPRELETIILKAMEKNPAERYATVQELANDLCRFLEDKPVRASRPTLAQCAAKWSRRHRSVVWAGALLLLVALIGSGVATLLVARQRDAAYANYQMAQENLETAYEILEKVYLNIVEKRLPREKELTPDDRQFLEDAQRFYEKFANQNSSDPKVRLTTAKAHRRVAGIHERLGQAEQAAAAYQQGLVVSVKLATDFPNDPDYRQNLARELYSLGGASPFFNRSVTRTELEQALAEALRIQEQLVQEFPVNLDYQQDLGSTCARLGYLHLFGSGRLAEAEGPVRKGVAIRQKLIKAKPSEFIYRRELGESLGNLVNMLTFTRRYDEADEVVRQELEVRQQLVDDFPAEPSTRIFLAAAYMDLALLREFTGKWCEAVEAHRHELRLGKQVLAAFPSMVPYVAIVARGSVRLGDALRKIGAQDEAIAAYEEAITACKEANRPPNFGVYDWWGVALARKGAGKEAVAVWEQGVQQGADMTEVANGAAEFLRRSLDPQIQDPEEVVLLAQKAVALAPQSGTCWRTLGAAYSRAGQWKEAVDALEKGLPLLSGGDSFDWFFLALAHWQLGEREQARHWYDEAVQWMDKTKPSDDELRRLRVEAAALLGVPE